MENKKEKKSVAAFLGQTFAALCALWIMAVLSVLGIKLLAWLWML